MSNKSLASYYYAARGYPPFILFVAVVVLAYYSNNPLEWWGLSLILVGSILRLWVATYIGSHTNSIIPLVPVLSVSGPYAFTRNPLYIANLVVAGGFLVLAGVFSTGILLSVMILLGFHYHIVVLVEEKHLLAFNANVYNDYKKRVPRWIGPFSGNMGWGATHNSIKPVLKYQASNLLKMGLMLLTLVLVKLA